MQHLFPVGAVFNCESCVLERKAFAVRNRSYILLALLAAQPAGAFFEDGLQGWKEKSFAGHSRYQIVEKDGRRALHGACDGGASVLYREQEIDLSETPVLAWSWRVDRVYPGVDERQKSGDDYPARVYVVIDGGLLPWRTLAINYVWASAEPEGAAWDNAFISNAKMLALRSGTEDAGRWVSEARNIRDDFRLLHGRDVKRIDGIAIMTDCDNTGGRAEAWFSDMRFVRE